MIGVTAPGTVTTVVGTVMVLVVVLLTVLVARRLRVRGDGRDKRVTVMAGRPGTGHAADSAGGRPDVPGATTESPTAPIGAAVTDVADDAPTTMSGSPARRLHLPRLRRKPRRDAAPPAAPRAVPLGAAGGAAARESRRTLEVEARRAAQAPRLSTTGPAALGRPREAVTPVPIPPASPAGPIGPKVPDGPTALRAAPVAPAEPPVPQPVPPPALRPAGYRPDGPSAAVEPWRPAAGTPTPTPTRPRLRLQSAGETARGRRERNDDTWLIRPELLVVADGVGGKPAGKTAADLAARTLRDTVDVGSDHPEHELTRAVELAHHAIVEQGQRDPRKTEMACTLDAVILHSTGRIVGVHVGDSRAYLCPADGAPVQATDDESLDGVLLQSLGGTTRRVTPHVWWRPARPGDRVVLASDGLWCGLGDQVVLALLRSTARLEPQSAVRLLIETALAAGSTDNVTVVVADVVENETAAAAPVTV